jgi:hypothetical protein
MLSHDLHSTNQSNYAKTYSAELTFALKTPRLIVCPAQFLTSVAKSPGSGLSCNLSASFTFPLLFPPTHRANKRQQKQNINSQSSAR